MGVWGYVSGIHGSVAPFLAEGFALSDAEMARLWAWVGLSALGALALGRQADRFGRRRVLLACFAALPLAAGVVAWAQTPVGYLAGQMLAYAAGGTLLGTVTVVIAEELPDAERARGQARAGAVLAAASALPLAGVALLAGRDEPWRGVWATAVLAAFAWPWLRRHLPETARWRTAAADGATRRVRLAAVFRPGIRRRALAVLAAILLVHAVELAARAWLFYHPVRSLGIAPGAATLLLVAGGGLGLVGFRVGGRLAERIGRRRTFSLAGLVFAASTVAYYDLSLHVERGRMALLAVSLFGLSAGGNAALVAFRSLAVELFPTALRATVASWMALGSAFGWIAAMGVTAILAPVLGGVGPAVAALAALALPVAALALAQLPETAGRSLEAAAAPDRPLPFRA